ncbi:nucleotidyltransferase [soil metagenome]
MSTQTQFTKLLADIEPSDTTKGDASSAHWSLRDYLATHETFSDAHVETFLSGSYGRNTSIRPREIGGVVCQPDVDVIVVTNHTLDDAPADVLDQLREVLEEAYDVEERVNARSVSVSTSRVKMDVVPIIEAPAGDRYKYYIPDREIGKWVPTNPPGHSEWSTIVNRANAGRFKPLVKLFKWWRRENPTAETGNRPKGFVIEKIVADSMSATEENYPELFTKTMESIVSRYAVYQTLGLVPSIEDPSVPGNNITSRLSSQEFSAFYKKAEEHAKLARKALGESDDDKAREMWQKIFGKRFPASGKRAAESLLSMATTSLGLSFPNHPVVPQKPGGFA